MVGHRRSRPERNRSSERAGWSRRVAAAFVALVIGMLSVLGLVLPATGTTTTIGFSVGTAPAPGSTELAPGGGYFAPTVAAGASYTSSVVIANANHNSVSVLIYPVDGLTSPGSGTAYSNSGVSLQGAGTWITVSRKSITLLPESRQTVSFVVRVPPAAVPGDHLAGIAIEGTSPQVAKTKSNVQVNVVTRSVVGVLVTVPGAAKFALTLGRPSITLGTYKIGTILVPMADTGGLLGKPDLSVKLTKAGYSKTVTRDLDTVLPGDSTTISLFWPDKLSGRYEITACASGAGLTTPVCRSASALAPGSATTPSSNAGPFPVHPTTAPSSPKSSSTPVLIILVAVLGGIILVGGGILLGARLGRRRQGSASRSADEHEHRDR